MEELLKLNLETKYVDFIKNQNFQDKELQRSFLKLLELTNCLEREKEWDLIRVKITNINKTSRLANPFYIGFGNPNSDLLFLGKEKGFDISKHPELFIKESINNIGHWNYISKLGEPINHSLLLGQLGFNPMFPRIYHKQKLPTRHTWGLYSQVVAGLYNKNSADIFKELDNFNCSFFRDCFISEINFIPSKYSQGQKLIRERKELLQNSFYNNFSKVVVGAMGYLTIEEIKVLFKITENGQVISLGNNRQREIKIWKFRNNYNQTIVYCNQLSGAAGWTNEAIVNLINHLK